MLVLALCLLLPSLAQKACVAPKADPEKPPTAIAIPQEFREELFLTVWESVRDFYIYPDFGGVDWNKVRKEFERPILESDNAWEVYDLLDRMVLELKDPYTRFIPPPQFEKQEEQVDPSYVGVGVLVDRTRAEVEGQGLRVLYVFPGSPAEAAGLKMRDRIMAVGGDPCPGSNKIRGEAGSKVKLTIHTPGIDPREVEIERKRVTPRYDLLAHRLEGNPAIGYIPLYDLGSEELGPQRLQRELDQVLKGGPLEGLILDLRGSRFVSSSVMSSSLGHFVSGKVGKLYTRSNNVELDVKPTPAAESLKNTKLVLLVDGATEGIGEQFAIVLQNQKRAQVVGLTTAGRSQGVRALDFPDGSQFFITIVGFSLPDGTKLERRGVIPDSKVEGDWFTFPETKDPHILKAIELIKK
jgi:C-terminal peptidase prc